MVALVCGGRGERDPIKGRALLWEELDDFYKRRKPGAQQGCRERGEELSAPPVGSRADRSFKREFTPWP